MSMTGEEKEHSQDKNPDRPDVSRRFKWRSALEVSCIKLSWIAIDYVYSILFKGFSTVLLAIGGMNIV